MVLIAVFFKFLTYLCFSNRANKKIRTWLLFAPVSQGSSGKWMQNTAAESGDSWWTLPAEGDGTAEVSLSLLFHNTAYFVVGTIQILFVWKDQITWKLYLERQVMIAVSVWSEASTPFLTFSTVPEILKRLLLCTHKYCLLLLKNKWCGGKNKQKTTFGKGKWVA